MSTGLTYWRVDRLAICRVGWFKYWHVWFCYWHVDGFSVDVLVGFDPWRVDWFEYQRVDWSGLAINILTDFLLMHWRGLAIDVSTCLVWRLTCWRIFYWRIGGVWPLTCPRVLNNDLSTGLIWLLTCWRIFYWRIGGVWPLTCRLVWIMTCRLVWFGCWQFDGCFVKVLAGFRLLTCQVVWLLPGLAIHPYHNMVTWPHHSMIIPQRDCERFLIC